MAQSAMIENVGSAFPLLSDGSDQLESQDVAQERLRIRVARPPLFR